MSGLPASFSTNDNNELFDVNYNGCDYPIQRKSGGPDEKP
jgi:hypothetical protein